MAEYGGGGNLLPNPICGKSANRSANTFADEGYNFLFDQMRFTMDQNGLQVSINTEILFYYHSGLSVALAARGATSSHNKSYPERIGTLTLPQPQDI